MWFVPPLRFPEFSGEWKAETITDACTLYNGRAYKQEELLSTGKYQVLRVGNFFTNDSWYYSDLELDEQKTIVKGDLLYAWSASFGPRFWTGEKAIYHYHIWKVIPKEHIDKYYLYYFLYKDSLIIKSKSQGGTMVHVTKGDMEKRPMQFPCLEEQRKIAKLLSLLDERIATQTKIIEDLKKLKSAIIHRCYSSQTNMIPLSELLKQCSDRNRSGSDLQVLSVSNKYGFIAQSNQFEDREVASDDTSNYKVVKKGMFAYNPARINVGSIALYEMDGNGIVSPMYVCFTTKSELLPSYLKYYFASQTFKHEMYKRLEGSVRLCLTFEELCNIEIHLPSIEQQKNISKYISKIENNLSLVDSIFSKYQQQRRYLLSQMFI